ncbi:MAG: hypothetical protein V7767_01395 [Leeuwenhoekiella sp.]
MKAIARDENQITLIYSSTTRNGQRTRAHVDAAKFAELQTIDIVKQNLTGTQWAEIASDLGKKIKDLISFEEVEGNEELRNGDFDDNDYIKILHEQPDVLAHPIVIRGERIKQIVNPTEVQEFLDVDSAGLKKGMMQDEPLIERQTKGEHYIDKKDNLENP